MELNEEQLRKLADEIEARAKDARRRLYAAIGREAAYVLLGVVIGVAGTLFVVL